MATYSNFKIWFWDDALTALGSTTNVIAARYKCGIDNTGEGEFTIPLVDTKARQWCVKYNVATFTCDIDGNTVCFGEIVIDRGDEIIRRGEPGLFTVKGLGRLSKLKLNKTNYQVISDGAGGATNTAVVDILALSQYATWNTSQSNFGGGSISPTAYLVTANESLFDTLLQALLQENHHFVDQPGQDNGALGTAETPENRVHLKHQMDQLSSSTAGFTSWYFLNNADPTSNVQMPIESITPITEEKEVVTRAFVRGGGLGSGIFTFSAASGTKSPPAGYSYNFTSSIITNTTLEAVSNQPRIDGVANISNIKPQDPTNSTAVLTAAEQLVDAGQRWIEERVGAYDEYYRIDSIAKYQTNAGTSFVAWPGYISGVRLTYSNVSPYDTSDALVDTTIINVDKVMHLLEVEYSVSPGEGAEDAKLLGNYLLGPAPRQERSFAELVADEMKEFKRRLDHADAQSATSTPPASTTYVTTDAPLVTATASAALANERVLTAGDGIDVTDGGANSTVTLAVDVTDIIGAGLGEDASNNLVLGTPSTLTVSTDNLVAGPSHTHAITTSSNPGAAAIILASTSSGGLTLETLTINGAVILNEGGGTAGDLRVESNTNTHMLFIDSSADAAIFGSNAIDSNWSTVGVHIVDINAMVVSESGGTDGAAIKLASYNAGASGPFAGIQCFTSNGTRGTPTATASDDILGRFGGGGHTGSAFASNLRGYMEVKANQIYTAVNQGTRIEFYTTADNTSGAANVLTLEADASVTVESGPLHVGAGSGAKVVNLNGAAGQVRDYRILSGGTNRWTIRGSNAAESGSDAGTNLEIYPYNDAGTIGSVAFRIQRSDGSVLVGNPTGGYKGAGTLNAVSVYDDNVLLTDYLFDLFYDGKMRPEDAKRHPEARIWSIPETAAFTKEKRHLPTMPGRDEWEASGKKSVGDLVTGLWATVEQLQLQVFDLQKQIDEVRNES